MRTRWAAPSRHGVNSPTPSSSTHLRGEGGARATLRRHPPRLPAAGRQDTPCEAIASRRVAPTPRRTGQRNATPIATPMPPTSVSQCRYSPRRNTDVPTSSTTCVMGTPVYRRRTPAEPDRRMRNAPALPGEPAGAFLREKKTTYASSARRLRVLEESSGMPGPIVVVIVALVMYRPFDDVGLCRRISSCAAA